MATVIINDDFERANTVVGGAGSITGVGNNWTDKLGGVYHIVSGSVRTENTSDVQALLLRPASENVLNQMASVVCNGAGGGQNAQIVLRATAGGEYYRFQPSGIQLQIYRRSGGATTLLGTPLAFASDTTKSYRFSAYAIDLGGGVTQLHCRIALATAPNTVLQSVTTTDSTAALQVAGMAGLKGASAAPNYATFYEASVHDFTDGVWPTFLTALPTPGVASYISATTTSVTINATASMGGTGALTYQWHSSQTSGFTPGAGNAISGATTQNLTAHAPAAGLWFYKRRTTDAIAATADTNQIAAQLRDAAPRTRVLGFIGDSITAIDPSNGSSTLTPADTCGMWLGILSGQDYDVPIVNQAHGGAVSADWLIGSATGYLSTALTAFQAAGVTDIPVMIGTNDSTTQTASSAATYRANVAAMCASILAAMPTVRIWLNYPIYAKPNARPSINEVSTGLILSYQPQIDSLVNGTTIRQGDRLAFRKFLAHAERDLINDNDLWYIADFFNTTTGLYEDDFVHTNGRGNYTLGYLWAVPMLSVFGLGGSGGLRTPRAYDGGYS